MMMDREPVVNGSGENISRGASEVPVGVAGGGNEEVATGSRFNLFAWVVALFCSRGAPAQLTNSGEVPVGVAGGGNEEVATGSRFNLFAWVVALFCSRGAPAQPTNSGPDGYLPLFAGEGQAADQTGPARMSFFRRFMAFFRRRSDVAATTAQNVLSPPAQQTDSGEDGGAARAVRRSGFWARILYFFSRSRDVPPPSGPNDSDAPVPDASGPKDIWSDFVQQTSESINFSITIILLFVPNKLQSSSMILKPTPITLHLSEYFIPTICLYGSLLSGSKLFRCKKLKMFFQAVAIGLGILAVFQVAMVLGYEAPKNVFLGIAGVAIVTIIAKICECVLSN